MDSTPVEAYRKHANMDARESLIVEHLGFVGRVVASFSIVHSDQDLRESLRSAGVVGLVEAANAFDPSAGVAFKTFAFPRVRGAIVDELRRQTPVSQRIFANLKLIRRACELLESPNTPEQISDAAGLTLDEVVEGLEAMRFINPTGWDDISELGFDGQSTELGPADSADRKELKEQLVEAIMELPERERLVVTLHYYEEMNLTEIAATLDLSISRVSRILSAAKYRIKEVMQCKYM